MDITAKIYIAGHQGLVGSAIMRALSQQGYKNLITACVGDLDLRNQQQVEQFFALQQPDYVFLAAAKVGGIHANNTYKAEFIYDNMMIAANVIHAAYQHKVKKLLNLGSSCIYPKNASQPLKEASLLSSSLEPTNEPYAIAKIAAIKLCHYYNVQYKTNFISAMPTNLYGPGDNFNLETSHVLPAILRKFHLAKLLEEKNFDALRHDFEMTPIGFSFEQQYQWKNVSNNEMKQVLAKLGIFTDRVELWGSGNVYREFLFVDDLAAALMFLMKNSDASQVGELINIGVGKDLLINELAELVKKAVGFSGTIVFGKKFYDGVNRKVLDISKIESLGWYARIELAQGVIRSYDYYKQRTGFSQTPSSLQKGVLNA